MAIRVKPKKPPRGAGLPRKKLTARPGKKVSTHKSAARPKRATTSKSLLARKPAPKTHGKKPFVGKAPHAEPAKSVIARTPRLPREFLVAAEPAAGHPFPIKKKKKKHQVVLRFTENTLKDIAALECVRRCFH